MSWLSSLGRAIKRNAGNVIRAVGVGALALTPAGIVHTLVSKVGGAVGSVLGSASNAKATGMDAAGALGGAVLDSAQATVAQGAAERQAAGLSAPLPTWVKPGALIAGACLLFYSLTRRAQRPRYR